MPAIPACLPGATKIYFSDFGKWDVNDSFAYRAETSNTAAC